MVQEISNPGKEQEQNGLSTVYVTFVPLTLMACVVLPKAGSNSVSWVIELLRSNVLLALLGAGDD